MRTKLQNNVLSDNFGGLNPGSRYQLPIYWCIAL